MSSFKSGLGQDFIEALNNCDWWKNNIIKNENLFIGIRNKYLNVYFHGSSLVKLEYKQGTLKGLTHYKYLLSQKREKKNEYIASINGVFEYNPPLSLVQSFDDLDDLSAIIQMTGLYSGEEKSGLSNILIKNPNIIDVEIAFSEKAEEGKRDKAPRVDFAALQTEDNPSEIVFFEAKHFSNQELRANKEEPPKVVKQIKKYEELIKNHEEEIKVSYRTVLSNFIALQGYPKAKKSLYAKALNGNLKINPEPRLVIYGFDSDQKDGKNWKPHKEKLIRELGKGRVLLKGDPKDFKTGISK